MVFILVVSNLQYLYRERVIQGVGHMNRGYKPLAKCDDHPDLTSTFSTLGRTIRVHEVRESSFRVWMIFLFFISNPSTSKSFCWTEREAISWAKMGFSLQQDPALATEHLKNIGRVQGNDWFKGCNVGNLEVRGALERATARSLVSLPGGEIDKHRSKLQKLGVRNAELERRIAAIREEQSEIAGVGTLNSN